MAGEGFALALPDPARASPRDLQSIPVATSEGRLYSLQLGKAHAKCIHVPICAIRDLTCSMTVTYFFEIAASRRNVCKELIRGAQLDPTDAVAESAVIPQETAAQGQRQRRVLVARSPPSSKSRHTSMTMSLPTGLRSRANPLTSALSQITLIVRGMPFECS
jgi:hypothetical protein